MGKARVALISIIVSFLFSNVISLSYADDSSDDFDLEHAKILAQIDNGRITVVIDGKSYSYFDINKRDDYIQQVQAGVDLNGNNKPEFIIGLQHIGDPYPYGIVLIEEEQADGKLKELFRTDTGDGFLNYETLRMHGNGGDWLIIYGAQGFSSYNIRIVTFLNGKFVTLLDSGACDIVRLVTFEHGKFIDPQVWMGQPDFDNPNPDTRGLAWNVSRWDGKQFVPDKTLSTYPSTPKEDVTPEIRKKIADWMKSHPEYAAKKKLPPIAVLAAEYKNN